MADLEPGSDPAPDTAPGGAQPGGAQPGGAQPPPAIPPPVAPTSPATIAPPVALEGGYLPAVEPKAPPKRGRAFGLIAAAAGIIGVLAFKFILPLVIVGVAGEALGHVFGGPFDRLPSDVKQSIEKRFDAAVGSQLDGLSDSAQSARVDALIKGGLPRLDDTALVSHLQLASSAFQKSETGACATLARAVVAGTEPPDDVTTKVIGALSDTELQAWFELQIQAVEAETRGSPAANAIADSDMDPYFDPVFAALSQPDVDALNGIANGETVTDAAACSALRGFYGAMVARPPTEVALFARYDVSP